MRRHLSGPAFPHLSNGINENTQQSCDETRGYKSRVPGQRLTSSERSAVSSCYFAACRSGVRDKEGKLLCTGDLCMVPSPATRDKHTWTLEMSGAQAVPPF